MRIETAQQLTRTKTAMVQTEGLIAKELSYSPQFQKQEYLASLRAHLNKLVSMIDSYQGNP